MMTYIHRYISSLVISIKTHTSPKKTSSHLSLPPSHDYKGKPISGYYRHAKEYGLYFPMSEIMKA